MCNACGNPAVPGPWTDAGAATPGDRLRARFHRGTTLNAILRPYGLTVHDGGMVPGLHLSTLTGAQYLVADLPALWAQVEILLGQPIDPMDARYIDG